MRTRTLAAVFASFIVLSSTIMAADASTTELSRPEAPRVKSISEALALAAEKNKPVLVDFYADW